MPLYLVKWPTEAKQEGQEQEIHLFKVANVTALMDATDELGDPGCAIYRRYNGPLSLSVRLVRDLEQEEELKGDGDLEEGETILQTVLEPDSTDGGYEMQGVIAKLAGSQKGWKRFSDLPVTDWPDYIQKMHQVPGLPQHQGVSLRPDHPKGDPRVLAAAIEETFSGIVKPLIRH